MSRAPPCRPVPLLALPGLVLAVLALVSQLALGAVVLEDGGAGQRAVAALDGISVLCSAEAPPGHGSIPPPHRHGPDGALCPMRVAVALHAVLLAAPPPCPVPGRLIAVPDAAPAQARAPPSRAWSTSLARGPPLPA